MTQDAVGNNVKLSKESILRLVNRIALPHIIVSVIMLLIILFYLFSFIYFQIFIAHAFINMLLSYPIAIVTIILCGVFQYFLFWKDWRNKVRQALLKENAFELIVRFVERRGKIRVEYFDENFPQRRFFNDGIFRETPVNDQLGHKIPVRVYKGVIWPMPVAIETEKSFLLVRRGRWSPTNQDLIGILQRISHFIWPWHS